MANQVGRSRPPDFNEQTAPGLWAYLSGLFKADPLPNADEVGDENTSTGKTAYQSMHSLHGNGVLGAYSDSMKVSRKRSDLYRSYAEIEESFPEISAGLDMYADYTVSGGGTEKDGSYHITTESGKYDALIKQVESRIKLQDSAWAIVRAMCRDGDELQENIVDGLGLAKLRSLPKLEMIRNEDRFGNLEKEGAFVQMHDGNNRILFDPWQVTHWRLLVNPDEIYGRSILWSSRRLLRELALMEDSISITRLSRAHQRYKWFVEVGDAPPDEADEIIQDVMLKNSKLRVMNAQSGRMHLRNNPLLMEKDLFIPKNGKDSVNDVVPLAGDTSNSNLKDIEHKYNRMFAGMKLSKAWFGLTGPNIRSVVGEQGLNFMRTIRRVRQDFKVGAIKSYMVGLRLHGVEGAELENIKWRFKFPMMSHADDELRFKLEKIKLEVATYYRQLGFMNRADVMEHVLGIERDRVPDYLKNADVESAEAQKEESPPTMGAGVNPKEDKEPAAGDPTASKMESYDLDQLKGIVNELTSKNSDFRNLIHEAHEVYEHIQECV